MLASSMSILGLAAQIQQPQIMQPDVSLDPKAAWERAVCSHSKGEYTTELLCQRPKRPMVSLCIDKQLWFSQGPFLARKYSYLISHCSLANCLKSNINLITGVVLILVCTLYKTLWELQQEKFLDIAVSLGRWQPAETVDMSRLDYCDKRKTKTTKDKLTKVEFRKDF